MPKRKRTKQNTNSLSPVENKSQSLPKFLDFMLIFFTSDGQFLARVTKVISDFPAGSSCAPRPIFTSSGEGALDSRNDK